MNPATDLTNILERWSRRDELLDKGVLILENLLSQEESLAFRVT